MGIWNRKQSKKGIKRYFAAFLCGVLSLSACPVFPVEVVQAAETTNDTPVITVDGESIEIGDREAVYFSPEETGPYQLNVFSDSVNYIRVYYYEHNDGDPSLSDDWEEWEELDYEDFDNDDEPALNADYYFYAYAGKTYKIEIDQYFGTPSNVIVSLKKGGENAGLQDGLFYKIMHPEDGQKYIHILEYLGDDKDVTVPSEIDGIPVKIVGDDAFRCKQVESVTISDGIEELRNSVFSGCGQLKTVTLPSGIELWGMPFSGCTALEAIHVPEDSDLYVEDQTLLSKQGTLLYAFGGDRQEYHVPETVKEIDSFAFRDIKIHKLYLPAAVTSFAGRVDSEELHIRNGACDIEDIWTYDDSVKIYAPSGSQVETYCKELAITFVPEEYGDCIAAFELDRTEYFQDNRWAYSDYCEVEKETAIGKDIPLKAVAGSDHANGFDHYFHFKGWRIRGTSEVLYVNSEVELKEGEQYIKDYVVTEDVVFVAVFEEEPIVREDPPSMDPSTILNWDAFEVNVVNNDKVVPGEEANFEVRIKNKTEDAALPYVYHWFFRDIDNSEQYPGEEFGTLIQLSEPIPSGETAVISLSGVIPGTWNEKSMISLEVYDGDLHLHALGAYPEGQHFPEAQEQTPTEDDVPVVAPLIMEGGQDAADVSLTVWAMADDFGPSAGHEQGVLRDMCRQFATSHPEWNLSFRYRIVDGTYLNWALNNEALEKPDVYLFYNDQIPELVKEGVLEALNDTELADLKNKQTDTMVTSVKHGEHYYGIPCEASTWLMYYDKSKYSETDVKSLEQMMEADLGENVIHFAIPLENSWYLPSFYYAAGGTMFGDGTDALAGCTFDNENGIAMTKYLAKLVKNPKFMGKDLEDEVQLMKEGKLAAYCSGQWDREKLAAALGDNLGVAKLPTVFVNGVNGQMKSFAGCKAVGRNPATRQKEAAKELMEYLGGAECQMIRYQSHGIIPTDRDAASSEAVQGDAYAVAMQREMEEASVIQPFIPEMDSFWTPVGAMGQSLIAGDVNEDNAEAKTKEMVRGILSGNSVTGGREEDPSTEIPEPEKPDTTETPMEETATTEVANTTETVATTEKTVPGELPAQSGSVLKNVETQESYIVISRSGETPEVNYQACGSEVKNVVIPKTVSLGGITYKVIGIEKGAFENNKKINEVKIGDNVEEIGKNAFAGCTNLKKVTIGSNVEEIGDSAFANCTSLTKVTMPAKTKKLGKNAFKDCKKLKTLTIKSKKLTAKSISKNAFKGLTKKTVIKVPKTKKAAYTKLFRKKGLSKKVKIK